MLLRDDFGYQGFIELYIDGDADLVRYRALPVTDEVEKRQWGRW